MWRKFIRNSSYITSVIVSFTAGVNYERSNVATVNAASLITTLPMPALPIVIPSSDTKLLPSRVSEVMQHGYPGFDNLRTFEDYVLSYDRRNRVPHWVIEHLSPDRMEYDSSVDRTKSCFNYDASIHPYFRSTNEDYKGSGYDRGHLAAAGNHRRSQNAIDQTFLLSNIAPQIGKGFNRDGWNKLEKHVRKLARTNLNVYVCTGPLYLPQLQSDGSLIIKYKVIGRNNIAVPTHFFKVVLIEFVKGKFDVESYLMPNMAIPEATPISNFMAPVNTIERSAGFLIFEKLPRNAVRNVNGRKTKNVW